MSVPTMLGLPVIIPYSRFSSYDFSKCFDEENPMLEK